MQTVKFPKNLAFGAVPLCAPASRKIILHGVPSRDLPFEVEIVKPHPYFRVDPNTGIIPAGGKVEVLVTYRPLTFGSMAFSLRLSIKIMGFQQPQDCVVSARAVSGLVEQVELVKSTEKVKGLLDTVSEHTITSLGGSTTFSQTKANLGPLRNRDGGTMGASSPGGTGTGNCNNNSGSFNGGGTAPVVPPISTGDIATATAGRSGTGKSERSDRGGGGGSDGEASGRQRTSGHGGSPSGSPTGTRKGGPARVRSDPTAIMLASTFQGTDAASVIAKSVTPTGSNERGGFGTCAVATRRRFVAGRDDAEEDPVTQRKQAMLHVINDGPRAAGGLPPSKLLGSKVTLPDGTKVLQAVAPVRPRGPGSGAVFDAASEWMSARFHAKHVARKRRQEKEAAERARAEAEAQRLK